MKKLLAAGAMAAMLAGAAFAVDLSGTAKITFDAFSINNADPAAWTLFSAPADGSSFEMKASTSDEKAGASVIITAVNAAKVDGSIWFKPVDVLKVSVGTAGYGVDVDLAPVSFGGTLAGPVAGSTYTCPDWSAYVQYKNDDMTVKGSVKGKDKVENLEAEAYFKTTLIPSTTLEVKDTVKSTEDILWVKAVEKIDTISITEEVTTTGKYDGGATLKAKVGVEVPVEELTVYANVEHADCIAFTKSATTANAGVKGKFGVMSWDAGLKVVGTPADSKCELSVPVVLSVAF